MPTRILGLDPGETTGWGLVEADSAAGVHVIRVIDYGILTAEGDPPSEAAVLTMTRRELAAMLAVMSEDGVACVALEAPAYNRKYNRFADEVRGVCKEAIAAAGLPWCLVVQNTAKAAVGVKFKRRKKGEPRPSRDAAKKAVKAAVEERFGLSELSYHEADAIACALAYAVNNPTVLVPEAE